MHVLRGLPLQLSKLLTLIQIVIILVRLPEEVSALEGNGFRVPALFRFNHFVALLIEYLGFENALVV